VAAWNRADGGRAPDPELLPPTSAAAAASERCPREALCWLLLAAVLASPAAALELVVEAPPELSRAAADVRALAGVDLAQVLALTGLATPGPAIRIVLADERSELAHHAPSWVAGYAMGAMSTIVLFPARVPSYPDRNLEALVIHEVTHVLVSRAVSGRELPRWLDEGLATVAAREWALEDRARTAVALIGYRPHSVAEVDDGFSGDAAAAARAYALSAAFVRFLLQQYGAATTARLLGSVAADVPFDEAFRRATGVALAEAEESFFRREAFWGTWVPFLTSSTALWIGITALALLAIRSRRQRDADLRERWALEDAARAADNDAARRGEDDPRRWN
jgi:hypothetical protein